MSVEHGVCRNGRFVYNLYFPAYKAKGRPMKDIVRYLWQHRINVFFGLVALVIVDAVALLIPLFIKQAINALNEGHGDPLVALAGLILGVAVVGIGFRFLWRFFLIGSARRIERQVRLRFYGHLLKLSAPYYTRTKTGDLMAHATNDIEAVMRACGFGVLTLADAVIMTTAALAFMLAINVELTLFAVIPLPFVFFVVLGFGRLIHRRFERVQEVFSELMEKVREALSGIRVVKSFVQETGMERDYDHTNDSYVNANMHLVKVWGLFDPSIAFLSGLGTAIVLWAGGSRVITGEISIGEFVAFTSYLNMLVWPMMALGFMVNVMQRGAASMGRLNAIFNSVPEIVSVPNPKPVPTGAALSVRQLTFSYLPRTPVLKQLEFSLETGQTLGVVGPVGSGKSTLAHLIPRLFDPPAGTIFLGETDIRDLALPQLRQNMAVVPQDPFLFSTSLRENIRFGNPDAGEEAVIQAAKDAGIWDEIRQFPEGLKTVIGERGVSLSGGQKQRIGIARALLVDPQLLILDDCLSAVDAEKEEEILSNLRRVLKGRTSMVIAHRISAVRQADWIIVLDEHGAIQQQGVHQQLIVEEGFYRHLHTLQKAERQLKAIRA